MKSRGFIYVSLAVDILIAISKFIAAVFTGSSSMLSEGVHSVIDAISQVLLIWGVKTSTRQPDAERPFGYGKELYFWSFVVSLVTFLLGGCISFYDGIVRFNHPDLSGSPKWNYGILGIAFIFTSISMYAAYKAFNKQRKEVSFWKAITESKDPSTFISLLGDIGDMVCLVVAFLGVYLSRSYHNHNYDGIASLVIGLILIAISLVLLNESKSLLMGETIGRKALKKIITLTEADNAITKVKQHSSMYMAPEEVLLQMFVVFKDGLTTHDITDSIERITKAIQAQFPRIKHLFIEPVSDSKK